jgi:hypothetical protein
MKRAQHLVLCLFASLVISQVCGDVALYDGKTGQLENNWENWSWATVSLTSTDYVAPGDKYSISVVINNYQALYLHTNGAFTAKEFSALLFSVNGGATGSEPVNLQLVSGTDTVGKSVNLASYTGGALPSAKWLQVSIPLTAFGVDNSTELNGFWWQAGSEDNKGTIYLDDIALKSGSPPPITTVTVKVDITQNRHPFSKLVFGANFASVDQLKRNRYTVNRWGGEAVTRYAWDVDSANHASDWFFEDLAADTPNPNNLPFNSTADMFVADSLSNNALPIVTVPLLGYAPFDRQTRCGFSVKKYGPQQKTDPYQPDCGNGVKADGSFVTGNDPADTSRVIDETYVLKWLAHLDQVFGKGKVFSFELDNEPGLWNTIHRDVKPVAITYDELWSKTVQYAGAIRKAYPDAKIYGPVPWGWCEYMFSPRDGCSTGADRQAHGDIPLLQWYIQQVGLYKSKYNVQLVDVIDVHIYPQASNIAFSSIEDSNTAALRFRSTRAIWDSTYVDESWIAQPIFLVTRVQKWIDQYAPGLKVAVSEYNWGNDEIITGALAQAIILGIFARENVYLATRWVSPASNTKTEAAFQLYTNYDGKGSSVSGDSVYAVSDNDDVVSPFGFYNNSTVFVVLVNKRGGGAVPVTVDVSKAIQTGKATIYTFSKTQNVVLTGAESVSGGKFSLSLSAWSAALAVVN